MTLQGAQQEGYIITESEIHKIERLILGQYYEAEKLIDARLAELFAQMSDLNPEDRYNWLIQYDRNIKLKNDIRAIYTKHDGAAYNLTIQSNKLAISNNYYRQFYQLNFQEPLTFAFIPDDLINYAVTGQIESWKALSAANKERFADPARWPPSGTLLDTFRQNRTDVLQKLQRQINSGMIAGDSYTAITGRVKDTIGKVTPAKTTGQMAKARRIVRTEGNRLMNAGSHASALTGSYQGHELVKMWDATLDNRTRPAHAAADGQTQELDDPFIVMGERLMYPGDPAGSAANVINDRCQGTELIDGEKPTARRGRDPYTGENSVFNYKNFNRWADDNGLTVNKYGMLYQEAN